METEPHSFPINHILEPKLSQRGKLAPFCHPHLSFEIPQGLDAEAQGLEALLQPLAVHVGSSSSRQTRVWAEGDVVDDQAVSARVCLQLVHLAHTSPEGNF